MVFHLCSTDKEIAALGSKRITKWIPDYRYFNAVLSVLSMGRYAP